MEMNTNNLGFMASYVEKDIHKAINIRGRFEDYLRNFTDIDEPNSIKTAKSFAKEFKEFEDTNFSLVPMNYLYGNMSKAYLHSKEFDKADSYTVAYYKLNKKSEDEKGIIEALNSIIDVQIVKFDFDIAYYFCEEYLKKVPDSKTFHDVKNMLTKLLNKKNIPINMIEFEKKSKLYLDNVKMPKLYSILIDDEKIAKESALRVLSYTMGISKKSAERYWNYAMENKDKMFHSHLDLFEAYNTNN